jgi:tol-pal system protein YbgF
MSVRLLTATAVAALCLTALPVVAADKADSPSVDAARREALADMLLQLEQLQAELRDLRGKVEVQTHEMEALKGRQRDLIADIDRRLSELERRGAAPAEGAVKPGTPATVPAEVVPATIAQEQQEYDAAFALLKQGQYERAGKRFRDFIRAHPKSPLADNAQYWIGESAYVVRNFRQALEEFSKLLREHPASPKAPDAMLKVGYCYYELADWGKARETLNQVLTRYPNTPVARSAEQRLAKMKKEGR